MTESMTEGVLISTKTPSQSVDNGKAAELLNVVRQRSAFRKSNTTAQNTAAVTAMTIAAANYSEFHNKFLQ
jgi:starch-binding outer membrane protein, SusD/RagB family